MSEDRPLTERTDALRRAGDLAGAKALLEEGLDGAEGPLRGRLLVARGQLELDAGLNNDASDTFLEALQLLADESSGELGELCLDRGRALRRTGDLGPALTVLARATELYANARSPEGRRRALAARGKVLYVRQDWKGARGAFRAALDQKGTEPPSWRLHHAMVGFRRRARARSCRSRLRSAHNAQRWTRHGRVRCLHGQSTVWSRHGRHAVGRNCRYRLSYNVFC